MNILKFNKRRFIFFILIFCIIPITITYPSARGKLLTFSSGGADMIDYKTLPMIIGIIDYIMYFGYHVFDYIGNTSSFFNSIFRYTINLFILIFPGFLVAFFSSYIFEIIINKLPKKSKN